MLGLEAAGQFPTTGGLSSTDLIALLSIVVVLFGLLLTAIGVLVLRQFTNAETRVGEVKADLTADIAQLRIETHEQAAAIWAEIRFLRTWLAAPEHPNTPPPGTIPRRRATDRP